MSISRQAPARRRRLRTLLAPLALCAWLPASAFALTIYPPGSGPEDQLLQMFDVMTGPKPGVPRAAAASGTAARSGSPGDSAVLVEIGRNVILPNPEKYYAVTRIGIEERSNNPCLLTLWGGMVDPRYASSATRKLASFELGRCGKTNPLSTWVDFKLAGFELAKHSFIRSVRVCGGRMTILPQGAYSSGRWEIKGLTVLPGMVSDGRVVPERPEEVADFLNGQTFVRPNCPKNLVDTSTIGPGWSTWSECPLGQLLTGLTVHHYQGKHLTGLTVRCKSARMVRAESTPIKDATGY